MGVYAITGASIGIGAKTKELLLQKGHEVINIDLKDGDICVNLATPEGRQAAVDKLHELHPEGLDGMICNAGVSGACGNLELIISLNYFGTVAIAKGVYDLLKKKHGSCVDVDEPVVNREMLGAEVILYFDEQGKTLAVRLNPENQTKVGEKVSLYFDMDKAHVFDPETEENLFYREEK